MSQEPIEEKIDEIISRYPSPTGRVLSVLEDIQEREGYLSKEALKLLSKKLEIPLANLYSLATFYSFFNLKAVGTYTITVCMGTACHVKGAPRVLETLKKLLGIDEGETTPDGSFTLSAARCFGACSIAPVIKINDRVYGHMTPEMLPSILKIYGWREKK